MDLWHLGPPQSEEDRRRALRDAWSTPALRAVLVLAREQREDANQAAAVAPLAAPDLSHFQLGRADALEGFIAAVLALAGPPPEYVTDEADLDGEDDPDGEDS